MAPTPLAANSFDDNGVLVRNRTDVAVCEGYPLALDLWASDGNAGDKVRLPFRAFESLADIVIDIIIITNIIIITHPQSRNQGQASSIFNI